MIWPTTSITTFPYTPTSSDLIFLFFIQDFFPYTISYWSIAFNSHQLIQIDKSINPKHINQSIHINQTIKLSKLLQLYIKQSCWKAPYPKTPQSPQTHSPSSHATSQTTLSGHSHSLHTFPSSQLCFSSQTRICCTPFPLPNNSHGTSVRTWNESMENSTHSDIVRNCYSRKALLLSSIF